MRKALFLSILPGAGLAAQTVYTGEGQRLYGKRHRGVPFGREVFLLQKRQAQRVKKLPKRQQKGAYSYYFKERKPLERATCLHHDVIFKNGQRQNGGHYWQENGKQVQ